MDPNNKNTSCKTSTLDSDLERFSTSTHQDDDQENFNHDFNETHDFKELNRSLSPRQVSMLAIAGVIGTGLYLGTGKALASGGPLSLLITYTLMSLEVYLMMLALGEMSCFMPVAGSFCTFSKKFGSESFGFAILINYWFNDAVSVASDLTALQLILKYWTDWDHYWVVSLIVWILLLILNIIHVKFYGETEYWLALLKILAIIAFFIVSIIVNAGHNIQHEYIGFKYWTIGDAPFVDGFKGFAKLFVTAAFAFGGTESLLLTGGEMSNPIRSVKTVTKTVFWRIFIFYIFSIFFIAMNVPYNYPNLSNKSVVTSPFTIVFQQAGSKGAGSFMNAVILTSVISAGNHALYAGSRLAFTLGTEGYLPKILTKKNRFGIPYIAVLITWFAGGLCFGSSFIGAGDLWSWLQNLVGVSNQISWLCIGIISLRFRKGLAVQNRTNELKFKNWTYPYGPWFVVIFTSFILLVQGWSSFAPWNVSDFFSVYLELIVFPICLLLWWIFHRKDRFIKSEDMDFDTDRYIESEEERKYNEELESLKGWAKWRRMLYEYFI